MLLTKIVPLLLFFTVMVQLPDTFDPSVAVAVMMAVPAALAGKHILCEKPLDVTTEKVDEIIAACDKTGVLLSSVFQSRQRRN